MSKAEIEHMLNNRATANMFMERVAPRLQALCDRRKDGITQSELWSEVFRITGVAEGITEGHKLITKDVEAKYE